MTDLIERLKEDWECLKDGYQENLTKTWHDHAMENAANDALEASERIKALEAGLRALRVAHGKGSSTGQAITQLLRDSPSQAIRQHSQKGEDNADDN